MPPISLQTRVNSATWRGMARLARPRPTFKVPSRSTQRQPGPWLHTSAITQRPEPKNPKRKPTPSPTEAQLEDDEMDFVIDPDEVHAVIQTAKSTWPTHPNLPSGWSSDWSKWSHLLTFFYPAPYYFLRLPQIEMFVNIRHAIRGDVLPLAYNNSLEGFVFTTIRRTPPRDLGNRFYYIDWKRQELFRIEEGEGGGTSEKRMVQLLRDSRGIEGMNLVKLRPDPEGDRVVQRILDHDDTVIPLLGEKYLEYTPAPTEALLDHYIGEAEALTQGEEVQEEGAAVEEHPGEPETTKALEDILESMRGKVPEDQEEEITRRLYELQAQAPEELGELLEMAQKMDGMTEDQAERVGEEIQEAMGDLMDEVSQSSKTLAKLLKETKKQSKANA